ncbi:MAG: ABC-type Mn2+/Zn2+ transport system, permease component [Halorubrum sp. J07HR59]|nr:MAG: ABC-type Mn2+/Zn2+ transport system, permease component [Halorubrum sp. J07HR59]
MSVLAPVGSFESAVVAQSGTVEWLLRVVLNDLWGTGLDIVARGTGLDILASPFMQRAYLAAICVAIIGPLVGSFLVHREMAMIADTLAHSAFAGVAVGLFVNATFAVVVAPLLTALVVAAIAALLVQTLVDYVGAYRDTSLAIVLTGAFAVGSVLVTATDGGIAVGINAYLFGSLATVSRANAAILLALSLFVTVVVAVAYRPLVFVTFDEVGARAAGLNVSQYNQLLAVLTAVVVVGAMQIMGVILGGRNAGGSSRRGDASPRIQTGYRRCYLCRPVRDGDRSDSFVRVRYRGRWDDRLGGDWGVREFAGGCFDKPASLST